MFQCINQCSTSCNNSSPFRNGLKIIDNSYRSLSPEEQERIHRDLYGVEEPTEETPEFIDEKLEELEKELDLLSDSVKRVYLQAKRIEQKDGMKKYVTSRKFRLIFLRVDRFDARKAASRLARYLKEKVDLFGYEVLCRGIREDDLTTEDIESLTCGYICVTNETDTAGRLIMFVRRRLIFGRNVHSLLRSMLYMLQIAVENNEEAQKKGLVVVIYNVGVQQVHWPSRFKYYAPIFRHCAHAFPIRMAAIHIFYNDVKESILLNLSAVVFPNHLRSRYHTHGINGFEECLLLLLSLGINPSALPFTDQGVFLKEALCKFLAEQRCEQHDI